MRVALTGVTGNMGLETLKELLKIDEIETIKVLILREDERTKVLKKHFYKDFKRLEILVGNVKDSNTCKTLIQNTDYVVNMAAVIPPSSDKNPIAAIECNQIGAKTLVSEIEKLQDRQPKFIHISTVALYGNRNHHHIYGQVGDPLLVSPFDIYSATKLRGEYTVLESKIKNWVVLRQSAMLHKKMLTDNISDGLMFHTCFNAPLEWVTAHDSGVLIANIIRRDMQEDLSKVFWKKVFNIGSVAENRITGFDTLNDGFKLIGGSAKDFFKPTFNAMRNFHGVWFYDGHKLNDLFNYQTQSTEVYWKEIADSHKYYKLAKILPKSLISKLVIQRLFKDNNSPAYWYKHQDEARMIAYYGSTKEYESVTKNWNNFNLLNENKGPNGENINYDELRDINQAKLIDYHFDFNKDDSDITIDDIRKVAQAHGGQLLSETYTGDMYSPLRFKTQDGEEFEANPYTILRAGHWYNIIYKENVWDFDRLSKNDKIFAQIWYDSHDKNENYTYYYDEDFKACIK